MIVVCLHWWQRCCCPSTTLVACHCDSIVAFPSTASLQQPLSSTSSYRLCLPSRCASVDCSLLLVVAAASSPLRHHNCLSVAMPLLLFHPPRLFSSHHPPPHPTIIACPAPAHKLIDVSSWWRWQRCRPSATVVACPLPGGKGGCLYDAICYLGVVSAIVSQNIISRASIFGMIGV